MKLNCVKTCKNEAKVNEGGKKNVYQSFITCIFVSRPCLFKVLCLKLTQEKTTIFIFSLYLVTTFVNPVHVINDQPNAFFSRTFALIMFA